MIGPLAGVGEVGALFAFAIDFFEGQVHVDGGDSLTGVGHLSPDFFARVVNLLLERTEVQSVEPAKKINGRSSSGHSIDWSW